MAHNSLDTLLVVNDHFHFSSALPFFLGGFCGLEEIGALVEDGDWLDEGIRGLKRGWDGFWTGS